MSQDPQLTTDFWAVCKKEIEKFDTLIEETRTRVGWDRAMPLVETKLRILEMMERIATGRSQPRTMWDHLGKDP